MMFKIKILSSFLLMFVTLVSVGASAEMRSTALISETSTPHRFLIDAYPTLQPGIGLAYEISLSDSITFGPQFAFFKPGSYDSSSGVISEIKPEVFLYGVHARWFTYGRSDRSGGYLTGGVNGSTLSFDAPAGMKTMDGNSHTEWGPFGGLGYQFVGRALESGARLFVDLGLLYGHGYAIERSYRREADGTGRVDARIPTFVFAEIAIGYGF